MIIETAFTTYHRRRGVYDALRYMPPLSHWPDRPAPWRADRSEVLAFIRGLFEQHMQEWATKPTEDQLTEANRILSAQFGHAEKKATYDPITRLWRGVHFIEPWMLG